MRNVDERADIRERWKQLGELEDERIDEAQEGRRDASCLIARDKMAGFGSGWDIAEEGKGGKAQLVCGVYDSCRRYSGLRRACFGAVGCGFQVEESRGAVEGPAFQRDGDALVEGQGGRLSYVDDSCALGNGAEEALERSCNVDDRELASFVSVVARSFLAVSCGSSNVKTGVDSGVL